MGLLGNPLGHLGQQQLLRKDEFLGKQQTRESGKTMSETHEPVKITPHQPKKSLK